MQQKVVRASKFSLASNIFLFALKLAAGILSNSIAVISDAINSLSDILTNIAVHFSVKVSYKGADEDHQYGHHAAQPIAAMMLAIFAGVAGITVIRESITRIIEPTIQDILVFPVIVLCVTIVLKSFMAYYFRIVSKKYDSPAVRALSIDSLNDVLSSSIALIAIIISTFDLKYFDGIAGILIAFFIFRAGYHVAKENIDYLMGKAASDELINEISNRAKNVNGVIGLSGLRSHQFGNKYHVEVKIKVDENHTMKDAYKIAQEVKDLVNQLPEVADVFVHIEPCNKNSS
ncbi:MAG: cation diffusion facilitator family transporter [Ignavibacteria bacterium]|nr:cation diffusion facilitator family transporter [Ignavibacteria bacterium]